MKASLFALFVALLMVGCEKSSQSSEGVDMNDTVPKKDAIETAVDYDDLEYRNEVWYLPNEKTPFTGRAEGFYENGQKVAEGNYKDGEPDGLETHWFENGQKDWEANFKDGKKDGLSTWWYESGQKKEVQNYKDGEMEGLWTEWYRNGQKKRESSWKDGKVRSAEAWKPNGEKCPVTNLKDGNGVSVGYNEDGTELFRQTYKDGKRFRWLPPQVQTPQYPLPANPQ